MKVTSPDIFSDCVARTFIATSTQQNRIVAIVKYKINFDRYRRLCAGGKKLNYCCRYGCGCLTSIHLTYCSIYICYFFTKSDLLVWILSEYHLITRASFIWFLTYWDWNVFFIWIIVVGIFLAVWQKMISLDACDIFIVFI